MNGNANCIFEVCCPPSEDGVANEQAIEALSEEIHKNLNLDKLECYKVSRWVYKKFDLAPRGSLKDFKAGIIKAYNNQQ